MRSSTYESYCRTLLFGSNTVLCKSNASEMHVFRSLFTPTFQESLHESLRESSSDNLRPFERNFPGTKNAESKSLIVCRLTFA